MLERPPLTLIHAQTCICDTHQVHDADELKRRLTKVWHGLGQSVIDDAMYEWHKRLCACV